MPTQKLSWEAAAVVISIIGAAYFLGGQNSETLVITKHNTVILQEMKAFVLNHNKEKQLVFREITRIKVAMKYYHGRGK
jgi:hypothetical protein